MSAYNYAVIVDIVNVNPTADADKDAKVIQGREKAFHAKGKGFVGFSRHLEFRYTKHSDMTRAAKRLYNRLADIGDFNAIVYTRDASNNVKRSQDF